MIQVDNQVHDITGEDEENVMREIKGALFSLSLIMAVGGGALALSACRPNVEATRVENSSSSVSETTPGGQGAFLISHDRNEDAPDSYIYRDKTTGCEYVVWMWSGLSSQPRMERTADGRLVQRCQGGQAPASTPTNQ